MATDNKDKDSAPKSEPVESEEPTSDTDTVEAAEGAPKAKRKRARAKAEEPAEAGSEAGAEAGDKAPEEAATDSPAEGKRKKAKSATEPGEATSGEALAADVESPEAKAPETRGSEAKATKSKAGKAPKDAEAAETADAPSAEKPAQAKSVEPQPTEAKAKKAADVKSKPDKKAEGKPELHLMTGFPGFIARRLLRKLAIELPGARFGLLVQPQFVSHAERALVEAVEAVPSLQGRAELLPGDITEPGLGIEAGHLERLLDEITQIWHLAAVYDLAVGRAVAYRVNVVGTANVLDLCERLARLARLNYISTCYVAGDREGLILERELDEGQGHKNHYEATKFWAEIEVQRRWDKVPTTIYRPGIVVGDSRTGETDKYDGPYYFIRFLQRLPDWLPMVNVGQGEALVNLVPVDYVVDAMVAISRNPDAAGKVVHLADPNPMRARDLVGLILKVMGRRGPVGQVPSTWFDRLLRVRRVRRVLGMPREVLAYFNHPARFDVANAIELLSGSGVRCPHISTYVRTLVDYVRRNPNKMFLDQRAL